MAELVFWHERRVPEPDTAEDRYQRIMEDEHPVPLQDLDPRFQDFVRGVRERAPEARILELGRDAGEPLFSRLGIVVSFPSEQVRQFHSKVVGAARGPRLHTYDRDSGMVFGIDQDPDIEVS